MALLVGVMGPGWVEGQGSAGACWYSREDRAGHSLTSCPQLSVVEYDPGTHDLKTLSLHYFEEPELRVGHIQAPRPAQQLPPPPTPVLPVGSPG